MTSVETNEEQVTLDSKEKLALQIIYFGAVGSALLSLIPVFAVVGVVVWIGLLVFAYVKRGDKPTEVARSHYSNFITVFWIGLVFTVLAMILMVLLFPIGIIALLGVLAWELYRLIKGIVRMLDNRPYA